MAVQSLNYRIDDLINGAINQIDVNAEYITKASEMCHKFPTMCGHAKGLINLFKICIGNNINTLHTIQLFCGVKWIPSTEAIVERSIRRINWRLFDTLTEEVDVFDNICLKAAETAGMLMAFLNRKKRFVG